MLVTCISVIVLLGILEFNVIPHPRIGFFCNDPKISFKFTGDTISMSLLIIFSICMPIIVVSTVLSFLFPPLLLVVWIHASQRLNLWLLHFCCYVDRIENANCLYNDSWYCEYLPLFKISSCVCEYNIYLNLFLLFLFKSINSFNSKTRTRLSFWANSI